MITGEDRQTIHRRKAVAQLDGAIHLLNGALESLEIAKLKNQKWDLMNKIEDLKTIKEIAELEEC